MAQSIAGGFEPVARGLYLEGLAVDLERDIVWWSDVIGGGLHGLWPDGATRTFSPDRMWTGGVMVNHDGRVLSSGQGGIMWTDPATGASGWLIREIDGKPINGVNEMSPDGTGGIYFGVIDIDSVVRGATPGPSDLYRLTVDGQTIPVADGLTFVNGIMLSADGRRLYVNDSFVSTFVFDVQPDRSLTNKRPLVDKVDCDGMALDAEGVLWITGFRSSELIRVGPDGALLAPVPTPAGAITQIRFGGADMRDVYINAVPADAGDGLAEGALPTEKRSVLYRGRSETPGLRITPPQFKLD